MRKRHCLLDGGGKLYSAILCPKHLSPDGKYIQLGKFWSDEVTGWYPLDEVEESIVTVLKVFDDA